MTSTSRAFQAWEILPAVLVLALLLVWAVPAARDVTPDDLRAMYEGGAAAWSTGHPERARNWLSTSFLALAMALVSRTASLTVAAGAMNALNLLLLVGTAAAVWGALRGRIPRLLWWVTLACTCGYSPAISTVAWKQVNLIVLCLALLGFAWIRRGRRLVGAATLAVSLALKPLAIMLPLALLARRDTRRAGMLSLAGVAALTLLGQGFLALRAQDASLLSPVPVFENFRQRATAQLQVKPENFSPYALVRRLTGVNRPLQRAVILLGLTVIVLLANESIREHAGTSWEVLGFALLLSTLVGPISWSHYQVLLLPMFVLLAYRFAVEHAGVVWWLTLLLAYALTSLTQSPLSPTVPGALNLLVTGQQERRQEEGQVLTLSALAPYFLFLAASGWCSRHRARDSGAFESGAVASESQPPLRSEQPR